MSPTGLDIAILRSVRAGTTHQPSLVRALATGHLHVHGYVPDSTRAAIDNLIRGGYVTRGRGSRLALTPAGAALLPSPKPVAYTPYKPPAPPPMRPGAMDYLALPAMAAGQRRYGEVIG